MLEFITAGPNQPFAIALAVMILIALMEGVGTLFGMGLSNMVEGFLPELNLEVDVDLPEGETPFALSRLLGWLRFGQVPALILLIIFLTTFGLIGLGLQSLADSSFGLLAPGWIASIAALTLSLPMVRLMGGFLGKILPKDETSAVSDQTFIGRVAVITLGTSRQGSPAEGRLEDQYGQAHYLMIEPDLADEEFSQGEQVLLVKKTGSIFQAIRNSSRALVD